MVELETEIYSYVASMPEPKSSLLINGNDHSPLITEDTVISVDIHGCVKSYFKDDVWTLETSKNRTYLRFERPSQESENSRQILNDVKTLQYLSFFRPMKKSITKDGIQGQKQINNVLRAVSSVCLDKSLSISHIFSGNYNHHFDNEHFGYKEFVGLSYILDASSFFQGQNLSTLSSLVPLKPGFRHFVNSKIKELAPENKQTLPIPERIYLGALEQIEDDLKRVDKQVLNSALLIIEKNIKNPLYGVSRKTQVQLLRKSGEYERLCANNDWSRLPVGYEIGVPDNKHPEMQWTLKKLGVDSEKASIQNIQVWISKVQEICYRALVAYTGARLGEVQHLKSNSLKMHTIGNKKYPLLYGEGEKGLNIDFEVEFWVTNDVGEKAFRLAQRISKFIYVHATNPNFKSVHENERLLFPTLFSSQSNKQKHKPFFPGLYFACLKVDGARIKENDLTELNLLVPDLDLEREELHEEKSWHFTAHQFRRSLALYAMASGAVTLPSLRRQLRHLGEAITLFYSKGSCAASNILSVNRSFAKECNDSKPASTAIALHKFVVSEERIFGGMGQHLHRNDYLKTIIVDQDRTEVTKMVERGEIFYSETALGGCAETGNCDYRPFALTEFSHCQTCEKSMHKLSKVDKTINLYEISLNKLQPNTRQYKWRESNIQSLKKTRSTYLAEMEKGLNDQI